MLTKTKKLTIMFWDVKKNELSLLHNTTMIICFTSFFKKKVISTKTIINILN